MTHLESIVLYSGKICVLLMISKSVSNITILKQKNHSGWNLLGSNLLSASTNTCLFRPILEINEYKIQFYSIIRTFFIKN